MKNLFILAAMCFIVNAAHGDINVIDDAGNEIRLAKPARRIVSLAPHVTEILFAAGAGSLIVGAVEYSDYPPEAKKDRKSTRLNSSHSQQSRMPSSA